MENKLKALFLEVTRNCNAFCEHCGSRCGEEIFKELDISYFKKALDEIAMKYKPENIMLYITGGEPLIRKDLFQLTEYATSLGFDWGLVTNGILLNQSKINLCKKTKMSTISISIDGLPTTHDNFRNVTNAYNTIVKNIQLLKKTDFVEHIQITFTATKDNLYELPEVYRNMCMIGVDSFRISNIDLIGRASEHRNLLLDKADFEFLFRFINKYKNASVPVCWSCTHYFGESKDRTNKTFQCFTGKNVASILYDGTIYGCPNIQKRKELEQGNIKENNFVDIWENKFLEYRNENTLKSKKCDSCKYWDECKGDSFHTFDFNRKEQSFCYVKIFEENNEINDKKLLEFPTNKHYIEITPTKSTSNKKVYFSGEATNDLFHYFKWGENHPLNMYEQQVGLVGYEKNTDYYIYYIIPSILLNRSGNMATTNDFCLNYILDEVDVINENLLSLYGNSIKSMKLLGFAHSHPMNTEFRFSSSDVENETYYVGKFGDNFISLLLNPQKKKIVAFSSSTFQQLYLKLYKKDS